MCAGVGTLTKVVRLANSMILPEKGLAEDRVEHSTDETLPSMGLFQESAQASRKMEENPEEDLGTFCLFWGMKDVLHFQGVIIFSWV